MWARVASLIRIGHLLRQALTMPSVVETGIVSEPRLWLFDGHDRRQDPPLVAADADLADAGVEPVSDSLQHLVNTPGVALDVERRWSQRCGFLGREGKPEGAFTSIGRSDTTGQP